MDKLHLHRLRVQVLLWTTLPVIILLIIFSLTGIGTHDQSMRRLVAEENLRLVGAVSAAIAARLDHFATHLEMLAGGSASHAILDGMEIWRVSNRQPLQPSLPAWVTDAVQAIPTQPQATRELHIRTDTSAGMVVWAMPLGDTDGWLVGGVPVAALGLSDLTAVEHPNAVTTVALVDAQGQIIYGKGGLPATGKAADWPGVAPGLAGERGVLVDKIGNQEDIVAYAPVTGAPWVLLIREPLDSLIAPLFHFESALPLILVAATVVSFLTLYFGLRYVVRPLRSLAQQAHRIGQGDFDAAAHPVGGVDEIEELRQAIDAMAHRIQADQAALQDYLHSVTKAQEEERSRLARELHDDTVQTLIALDHKAQMVQRGFDRTPERARELVGDLRRMISGATQEVRRFSQALRPLYLEEVGLAPALEALALDANAEFRVSGAERRLGADTELALFRIAQELLNNARRHAHAQIIRVALSFSAIGVTLAVGDNGRGFPMPAKLADLTKANHFGLVGISERTQLIGGRLTIESRATAGTIVAVQVAYDEHQRVDGEGRDIAELKEWLTGRTA